MKISGELSIDYKPYYKGNPELKKKGVQIEYTPEQVNEIVKCYQDIKYFLANYVYIISLDKGKVLFDLYDFQEEMIYEFQRNRFTIATLSRQMGKTITVCAFLLYQAIFNNDYFIAILANNAAKSREILGRLKMMYELLPWWLKPGVVEWNKGSVEFSNGSKIFAGPTTNSSIRGFSINCVVGDTEIVVQNDDGEIKKTQIQKLTSDYIDRDECIWLDNKYTKWYWNFIFSRIHQKKEKWVTENHHILPESIFGNNSLTVHLSPREHFFAHKLLMKTFKGSNKAKMVTALYLMASTRKDFVTMSSREFSNLKERAIQVKKDWWEENKEQIMKQRYESDHYQKVSDALKLYQRTEEHTNKINKNPEKIRKTAEKHKGMKRSEETRQRQSQSKKEFIEKNGTVSFGKGMIYVHHKETGEVKRVLKDFNLGTEWIRGTGIKRSEETRRKISENNGRRKR